MKANPHLMLLSLGLGAAGSTHKPSLIDQARLMCRAEPGPILQQPEVRRLISDVLEDWNSPAGVGIAIVRLQDERGTKPIPELDWISETEGFGNATISGHPINASTQFAIASNSKLFTVLAVGQALEEAKDRFPKGWKTKICPDLLPDWCTLPARMDSMEDVEWKRDLEYVSKEATIEDLMSHRTGWPRHDHSYTFNSTVHGILTTMLPNLRRSTTFRDKAQYNNIMYILLSALPGVIRNTTTPFARLVKQHIFDPLNLTETTFSYRHARHLAEGLTRQVIPPRYNEGLPTEAWKVFTKGELKQVPYWNACNEDGSFISGAGGVISSVRDVASWLKVLLLKGANPATGEQIIPASAIEKAATGQVVFQEPSWPEMSPVVYGGGQWTGSYRGKQYIEHLGDTLGFLTRIIRFPKDGVGIAVMANDDVVGGYVHEIIKWSLVDKIFALDPIDWNKRVKEQVSDLLLNRPAALTSPSNRRTPNTTSLWALEGRYHNVGYGGLEVCVVQLPDSNERPNSRCQDIVGSLEHVLPGVFNLSTVIDKIPELVIRRDNFRVSHMKLSHFDDSVWNITLWKSLESPSDPGKRWANGMKFGLGAENAVAEFDVGHTSGQFSLQNQPNSRGLGGLWGVVAELYAGKTLMFSNTESSGQVSLQDGLNPRGLGLRGIWGAGLEVSSPEGNDVQSRSEVWLERI